jgi:NhaA family Na+:H+ antiporter
MRLAQSVRAPIDRFLHIEAASGILLLLAAATALIWANSVWSASYFDLWRMPLGVRLGGFEFERSLGWYVNDALMVIFFFVVGLEIRREIHQGELSQWRRAALPLAAALGGMLVPAGIYLALAQGEAARSGWGVPMATDIAFAVGILTLLGKRVPPAMRVLLLALAVIDDLGAILVIALFYSEGISVQGLFVAGLGFAGVFAMQALGVRSKLAYIAPTVVAWAGIYGAGVHPTIAGVIVGLLTPVRAWLGPAGLVRGMQREVETLGNTEGSAPSPAQLSASLRQLELVHREARSPAESLIEMLHPWVAFLIMPVFALANAGVTLGGVELDSANWSIVLGVAFGLGIGKPVGVLLLIVLAVRVKLAVLPTGLSLRHMLVVGVVAGIGFTMSLFIAQLAFPTESALAAAKLGVLGASALAAVAGLGLGWRLLKPG